MKKPKILLIADTPNWIFDTHCKQICKHLGCIYDFKTVYRDVDFYRLSQSEINTYDVIYILDNRLPLIKNNKERTIIGIRCEFNYKGSDEGAKKLYYSLLPHAKILHTVNEKQYRQFSAIELPHCQVRHADRKSVV